MTTKYQARSAQKLSGLNTAYGRHMKHLEHVLDTGLSDTAKELSKGIQASLDAAKKQLYKDMADSCKGETYRLLRTIPGIGPYVSASLIGEIQTMDRFKSSKALTAYAGLDPKIRQSGKVLNSTGKLTKRGSSYLRRSIFIAASVSRRYDPNMKAIYEKKRAEGKSYREANCVVARKILAIARAVWLSGRPYDVNFATKG